MIASLFQTHLGAAARIATTAILALLLLVVGQLPARVLPTLVAAGTAQAGNSFAQLEAADAALGLRPAANEAGSPEASLDADPPGRQRAAIAQTAGEASRHALASAASRPAARFRPRAPPTTV